MPVKSVGNRLKAIRTTANLSLQDVSVRTGVSKPMLGQIERGQSSPTVNTLWKIATGLKVPLSHFLSDPEPDYEIIRTTDRQPLPEHMQKMRAYPIFTFDPIRQLEMFFIEFDSGCQHHSEKHMTGVEEYIFVFSGTLELVLEDQKIILNAKEAIRFKADIPHSYINRTDMPCVIYDTIFYPPAV